MQQTKLKKYTEIFKKEAKNIKETFSKVKISLRFINRVKVQFNSNIYNNKERNEEDEMIIPPQLFKVPKEIWFYKYFLFIHNAYILYSLFLVSESLIITTFKRLFTKQFYKRLQKNSSFVTRLIM